MKKTRMLRMLLFGSAVIITVWRMWDMSVERSLGMEVIAHRGDSVNAPENTLAAMEHAISLGANMMEVDIRLTKDGVPVVFHDETLLRITGIDRPICELTSLEIRRLDAGKWFLPEFSGEQIPMLRELLEAAKGRIELMIEIKEVQNKEKLLEQTIAEIRKTGMERECFLASSSVEILSIGERGAPELKKIYIGRKIDPSVQKLPYIDGYSICSDGISKADVELAHDLRRKLYVWTVNNPWRIRKVMELGVDGVVTDVPELALKILNAGYGD